MPAKGAQAFRVGARNHHSWCHMWADSDAELHAFAKTLGMRRAWHQRHRVLSHYDLTPGRRNAAVLNGAVQLDLRVWLRWQRLL